MAVLPPELIAKVISYLVPAQDSSTLMSLMSVSTLCWEFAARILYRTLTLNPADLCRLATSPRGRLALTFTYHLELHPPPLNVAITTLWKAAAHGTLFPRVRNLVLSDPSSVDEAIDYGPDGILDNWDAVYDCIPDPCGPDCRLDAVTCRTLPAAARLFDCPDVCVQGWIGLDRLAFLLHDSRTVTQHGFVNSIASTTFPSWQYLRVFATGPSVFHVRQIHHMVRHLELVAPTLELCFEDEDDRQVLLDSIQRQFGTPPPPVSVSFGRESKPCDVCRQKWVCNNEDDRKLWIAIEET